MFFLLAEEIKAYEEIWIISDNFVATTYCNHFKKAKLDSFMKSRFDVHAFCNGKYNSHETNMLIRLKVTLSKAIEKRVKLPRFIVVVLDNDLIQFLAYVNKGIAMLLGEWFEWLVECYSNLCAQRKKLLPLKAVKEGYPQLYFIAPPRHGFFNDNEERKILFHCMEATVKSFDDVRLVKMMELWNFKDQELVNDEGQFTSLGLTTYWASVDAAIAFNVRKHDEFLSRRGLVNKVTNQGKAKSNNMSNKTVDSQLSLRKRRIDDKKMLQFFKRVKNRRSEDTAEDGHRQEYNIRLPTPK